MKRESDRFRIGASGRWHYLVSVEDDEVTSFEQAPQAQRVGVSGITPEDRRAALEAGLTALPRDLLLLCDDPRFQRFAEDVDPEGFSEFTDSLLFARVYVWKRVIAGRGDQHDAFRSMMSDFNKWISHA